MCTGYLILCLYHVLFQAYGRFVAEVLSLYVQKIGKMYHDSVQLVWEGNSVQGREKVERFLQVIAFLFYFLCY